MKINHSIKIKQKPLVLLIFSFISILVFINLYIELKVFKNPSPFTSSYWDLRWALIFGMVFFFIGSLFLLSRHKLLFILSSIGLILLLIIPIFTISLGKTYLVFILLFLIALGAGEAFLKFLMGKRIEDKFENLVISLMLGFGIIMILVMIQGFLNAFSLLVTWVGISVMSFLFVLPNLKRWFLLIKDIVKKIYLTWGKEVHFAPLSLFFGVFVVLLIPSWLIAVSPPMRYDEMTYHLTAPLLYLERGGIVVYPEGGMTVWMHYAEMLFTLAIQSAGLTLPRIFHLLFGLLSIGLTYIFGRRLINKQTGLFAAFLLLSVPVVGYEISTAYIDFFVTAYTTAVGFSLLMYWQEQNPKWLLVAGFLGGIGLGIKLTAGPMIAVMIGILILLAVTKHSKVKNYLWIGGMILFVVALALPWLIRDTIWTGDPFYPYGTMFIQRLSQATGTNETSQQINLLSKLAKYVTYPVDITFNSNRYYHESPGGMASVLSLLAIPLFLLSAHIKKQEKKIALILLGASIVTVWIMLLVNNALLRYALPVFPWLAISAAMNITIVSDHFSSRPGRFGRFFLLMIGLVYVFSTRLPIIVRLYDNIPQRLAVNYFFGRESKEEYLSRNLVVYDAYQFIDTQENGPHRVLSIGNEFRLYTNSRIDGIYDVAEAHNIVSLAENYDSLAKSLAEAGYDYILINQPEIDFRLWKYSDPYPILQNGDFVDLYAKLVFAEKGIYVYQFFPLGVELPEAVNLLLNPGFEDLITEFDINNWDEVGPIDMSENAFEGELSMQLFAPLSDQGQNYIYQKVTIVENQLYTLGYWVKSDDEAVFLMQIRWLDEQGNIISIEEDWKNVSQEWGWISKFSQSPEKADYAEIYASLGGSENALLDYVCLAPGQMCPDP
jgi:4-amino-4-deoxy-L-arabinose transferase-like glycosyltransferase